MDAKILAALQQIELIKGATVHEQHPETTDVYMRNCKSATYDRERSLTGPFGELIETAPNTFVKSYSSKDLLLQDLTLFRRAQSETINDTKLQAPAMILGYFTFDENTWHLAFNFGKAMYGETNEMLYEGGIVNPALLFPEAQRIPQIESDTKGRSEGLLGNK